MSAARNSSALSRIILEKNYLTGDYEQKVCLQCSQPLCLEACPTEPRALHVDKKSGTYARDIDPDLCIGCGQCIEACGRGMILKMMFILNAICVKVTRSVSSFVPMVRFTIKHLRPA
jgi:Fe-S-cluster-containing dehydrogenase component